MPTPPGVDLQKEISEAMKPRTIAINAETSKKAPKRIEGQVAACVSIASICLARTCPNTAFQLGLRDSCGHQGMEIEQT